MAALSQPQQASYDAIVIGAGIQGSFAAYHLAQRHQDTLLLEQFVLPHSRGSSHGQSRITRSAYPQAHYARMMPDSFLLWQRLEAEAGTSLYRRTGLVVLGPAGDPELEGCRRGAGPGDTLDAAALARRFPGLRPRAGDVALWDGSGGVLRADRALRAVQVGRVSPARGHAARRGEGAEHPARCRAHRHHHRRGVPSPPAHHHGRSLDQCRAGTAGPPPAAAAPAHRRVLLEGEGARQLQCKHGHPLLHGFGAARGSPRHLRAARPRVPRAGQGVLPPRQPRGPRGSGPGPPGCPPPRRRPPEQLHQQLPARAGAAAGRAGDLHVHEHPRWRLHPGPAPQAQQHRHRGRLLGPRVQAGAGGGEAAVRAEPGPGAVPQHGPLRHQPLPRRAPGCAVGACAPLCVSLHPKMPPPPAPCVLASSQPGIPIPCIPTSPYPTAQHLAPLCSSSPTPQFSGPLHPSDPISWYPAPQHHYRLFPASQCPYILIPCILVSLYPSPLHPSVPISWSSAS